MYTRTQRKTQIPAVADAQDHAKGLLTTGLMYTLPFGSTAFPQAEICELKKFWLSSLLLTQRGTKAGSF